MVVREAAPLGPYQWVVLVGRERRAPGLELVQQLLHPQRQHPAPVAHPAQAELDAGGPAPLARHPQHRHAVQLEQPHARELDQQPAGSVGLAQAEPGHDVVEQAQEPRPGAGGQLTADVDHRQAGFGVDDELHAVGQIRDRHVSSIRTSGPSDLPGADWRYPRGGSPMRVGQPLTAPVRPPTICRSATRKKTSAGSMDSAVNARTFAVSEPYWEANAAVPSGSVYSAGRPSTSSGSRNAFQLLTTASTDTVTSAGRDSGSRMRRKNRIRPQPSMVAASSSSPGMARMNGRRITIVTGSANAACGTATASSPVRSRLRSSR